MPIYHYCNIIFVDKELSPLYPRSVYHDRIYRAVCFAICRRPFDRNPPCDLASPHFYEGRHFFAVISFFPLKEQKNSIVMENRNRKILMANYKVTLKADLKRGSFYWVTSVQADSEEEAVTAAEHLFMAEMEHTADWSFSDSNIEPE